jgi:hypothetical protein
MEIEILDKDTEWTETALAQPPRILARLAAIVAIVLAAAVAWAWFARVDHVVRAPARVRPLT